MILVTTLSLPNVCESCESNPKAFKFCPKDLPNVPGVKLLCAKGCFLFHPDDKLKSEKNLERVKLIPPLQLKFSNLETSFVEAQSQRARALKDVETFRGMAEGALEAQKRLQGQLDGRPTEGDVVISFLGGVGGGAVLTIGAVILGALLL